MTGKEEVDQAVRTFDETPHPYFKKLAINLDAVVSTDVEAMERHLQSFVQRPIRVERLLLTWRTRPQDVSLLIRRVKPIYLVLDYDTLLRTSGARASFMRIMYAGHWTPDEFAVDDVNRLGVRYPSVKSITVMGMPVLFGSEYEFGCFHWTFIVSSFLRICTHMFPNAKAVVLENLLHRGRREYACTFSWHQWKPILNCPQQMYLASQIAFREENKKKKKKAPSGMPRPTTIYELVAGQREDDEPTLKIDKFMAWFMLKMACDNLPHLQMKARPW